MTHDWRNYILAAVFGFGVLATALFMPSSRALAFGASSAEDEANIQFKKAEKAINVKDYGNAVQLLQGVLKSDPNNADALNYLAFSQRNLGQVDDAMKNYNAALAIKPDHKGALEYQGELYLMIGNPTAAEANLDKLNRICKFGCKEKDILQAALEHFSDKKSSSLEPPHTSMTRY